MTKGFDIAKEYRGERAYNKLDRSTSISFAGAILGSEFGRGGVPGFQGNKSRSEVY
jgi:hypothetical protein